MIVVITTSIFIFITVYSYSLIDPNLTLINSSYWTNWRNLFVNLGYHNRHLSSLFFLAGIFLLFSYHWYMVRRSALIKNLSVFRLAVIFFLSYPFLSHDFFNYLFDAKIVTYYHQNPYLKTALDFPYDPWIRFMHWTHRTYPYGPLFLLITLLPSLLSFGKFILSYLFLKAVFFIFYFLAVYYLYRLDKSQAIYFAFHPLVIIEGLVNLHNDFIALCLAIIGISIFKLAKEKREMQFGYMLSFLSIGIKYLSLPVILLFWQQRRFIIFLAFCFQLIIIFYLSISREIQPWYFLNLLIFIPFLMPVLKKLSVLFLGLLLSYYPYIRLGGWDKKEFIYLKMQIIFVAFLLNILYVFIIFWRARRKGNFSLSEFLSSMVHT